MVGFYFVITWGEADAVERPLLDVFVAWDFVPALEVFVSVLGFPVELEDAMLVAVNAAVFGVGAEVSKLDSLWIKVDVCLELFGPFFF